MKSEKRWDACILGYRPSMMPFKNYVLGLSKERKGLVVKYNYKYILTVFRTSAVTFAMLDIFNIIFFKKA